MIAKHALSLSAAGSCALVAAACTITPVADAQPRRDYGYGPGLIAYDSPGGYGDVLYFGGRSPTYAPDLALLNWDGRVAALEVRYGRWVACEYPQFGGFCLYLSRSVSNLRDYGFAGRIRSIAEDKPRQPADIVLYEGRRFAGGARRVDGAGADLERLGVAGRVNSVRIRRGVWRFCTRRRGFGGCVDVDRDIPDLSAYRLRGRLLSVERVGGYDPYGVRPDRGFGGRDRSGRDRSRGRGADRAKLILFENRAFAGRSEPVSADILNLRTYGFSDRTSSIRVLEGRWEVCEHPNFGGRCAIIDGDVDDRDLIRLGLQDKISSLRKVGAGDARGGRGAGDRGGRRDPDRGGRRSGKPLVVLYRDHSYSGGSIAVTGDVPTLRPFNFDNRMTSIRILEGTWELCEHPNYGGACTTIKQDQDFSGRPFNDHLSSLRRIDR